MAYVQYREAAIQMAKAAGHMIRERRGKELTVKEKQSHYDYVTEVDRTSERLIREQIAATFPDHQVLGEEEASDRPREADDLLARASSQEYMWIVDPLDGTVNFVQGLPGFTVSIALAHYGEIVVGVIYDPSSDELFWAEKNKGAFLNDVSMSVSEAKYLKDSMLGAGLPAILPEGRQTVSRHINTLSNECLNIRMFGSGAIHLAYVAAGRFAGSWEMGLSVWDIAAGALLIQEAGGVITDINGQPYRLTDGYIVASNGLIHDQLVDYLALK